MAALQQAARVRHESALGRAEVGLRKLLKGGEEISFRAVARAGGVGVDFLYAQPELRSRIEGLRARQRDRTPPRRHLEERVDDSTSNVVRTLSAQLKADRARHRDQLHVIEERLAAAHAEILRLRRALGSGEVDQV